MPETAIPDRRRTPRRHLSAGRLWLFRILVVVCAPLFFFIILEGSLHVGGVGFDLSVLLKCRLAGEPGYCDNPRMGWLFFPPRISRQPHPFAFRSPKPAGTCRIFLVGGSAALGEPDPAFNMGRLLRFLLEDRYPGVRFEVHTAAMPAINSHVVLRIVKACARHEPDLFVVYMGNNEVVGPYGAGTVFAPLHRNLALIRLGIAARATRTGQLLSHLVEGLAARESRPAQEWQGMEMFLESRVAADDPRVQTVYGHFSANLAAMLQTAGRHGAAVVVSTVPCNRRDNPPFASLHRQDLSPRALEAWRRVYESGTRAESAGDLRQAVSFYRRAEKIDDRYADLHFRIARCLWEEGETDEAARRFDRALHLDALRFRSTDTTNAILRREALRAGNHNVFLADTTRLFARHSEHGVPGRRLFHDHVHLTFAGNYLAGASIFRQVEKALPDWVRQRKRNGARMLSEQRCAERAVYTLWDRHQHGTTVLKAYFQRRPFLDQLYHAEEIRRREKENTAWKEQLTPRVLLDIVAAHRRALETHPADWLLHHKLARLYQSIGKLPQAAAQNRLVVEHAPNQLRHYHEYRQREAGYRQSKTP